MTWVIIFRFLLWQEAVSDQALAEFGTGDLSCSRGRGNKSATRAIRTVPSTPLRRLREYAGWIQTATHGASPSTVLLAARLYFTD